MPNINSVHLGGNLTRDPELKYLPSGTAVANFTIAVNRQWTDKSTNQKKEEVSFIDCVAFARAAEVISEYMKKGRALYVEGRMKQDRWESEDGQKRSKVRVVVDTFQFLDGKRDGGGSGGGSSDPDENVDF